MIQINKNTAGIFLIVSSFADSGIDGLVNIVDKWNICDVSTIRYFFNWGGYTDGEKILTTPDSDILETVHKELYALEYVIANYYDTSSVSLADFIFNDKLQFQRKSFRVFKKVKGFEDNEFKEDVAVNSYNLLCDGEHIKNIDHLRGFV